MIGRLRRVPVSEMYGDGGAGFTAWLQENLDVLNDAVDLTLSRVRDERSPAPAGTVARDGSGGVVVIENEFSESRDVGLGRLISSLASVSGQTGIWIVADSRPEHASAVAWLNENSRSDFYLLKVEAFRIDDSPPAPLMTLIAGPDNGGASSANIASPPRLETPVPETRESAAPEDPEPEEEDAATVEMKEVGGKRNTTGLVIYQFWMELLEKASGRTRTHAGVEPRREPIVGAAVGTNGGGRGGVAGLRYNYVVGEHDASVELLIDRGEGRRGENEQIFDALRNAENAIAYNFGDDLEWREAEYSGARRVIHRIQTGGYREEHRWPETQDAMIDAMIRLEKAMRPHISRLQV